MNESFNNCNDSVHISSKSNADSVEFLQSFSALTTGENFALALRQQEELNQNNSDTFNLDESQRFFVKGSEETYQNIGIDVLKLIAELPTPVSRRQLMSIATRHTTREGIKVLLQRDKEISKKEWTAARKHCKFPGPGQPIPPKPKYFRKKLDEDVVADFLQWMHANDYIQNVAFGHKVVSYCNGVHTAIEAVKLTSNHMKIIRDYAKEWQENDESVWINDTNLDDETNNLGNRMSSDAANFSFLQNVDQCHKICPKSKTRCFREKGHEGRHSFTPKGRLSPSTIEKIISSMTAGKIRSLAGLDDTDVTTGSENFENMRSFVKTLNDVARSEDSKQIARDLISCIDRVEEFHKIGFPRHLGQGEIVCFCSN